MTEQVVQMDLGVRWDPNAPSAILVCDDFGRAALGLQRHLGDQDQRCVVVVWNGARYACLSDPNDEAISGHRLYRNGLSDVTWAASVRDSKAIDALERQNRVHPSHDPSRFERLAHHVLLMNDCVAEVVAETVRIERVAGTTLEAAVAAMRH